MKNPPVTPFNVFIMLCFPIGVALVVSGAWLLVGAAGAMIVFGVCLLALGIALPFEGQGGR